MTTKRTYERTHPWLTFTLDLERVPPLLWLLLGEARSKCEHLRGVPLRPDTADKLHVLYLAKGVQGTTAIEGNTLSEEQVEQIIRGELKLPPSKEYLQQEVRNIVDACDMIWRLVSTKSTVDMTPDLISSFNKLVLNSLKLEPEVTPGQIRTHSVGVMRYRGAPPEDCEYLLGRLCSWLRELNTNAPSYLGPVGKAILLAILAHLYIAWIHPFADGNGRTARLVELAILVDAGVPTPAAHLLSNHYNATRSEYYRQLDYASKSGGDIVPFVTYAAQGMVDDLRSQIATVRDQQLDVAWRNYVHERFKDQEFSQSQRRCKHLILDLSTAPRFVARKDLTSISPRVTRDYQGKTDRTLSRDIALLGKLGLLAFEPKRGFRARKEIIAAFLPEAKSALGDTLAEEPVGKAVGQTAERRETKPLA
jgi:Fic family protein